MCLLVRSKTAELNKMIEEISQKLNMLNIGVIKAEDFSNEKLEDLEYLHQMVMKRNLSVRAKCRQSQRNWPHSENKHKKTGNLFRSFSSAEQLQRFSCKRRDVVRRPACDKLVLADDNFLVLKFDPGVFQIDLNRCVACRTATVQSLGGD